MLRIQVALTEVSPHCSDAQKVARRARKERALVGLRAARSPIGQHGRERRQRDGQLGGGADEIRSGGGSGGGKGDGGVSQNVRRGERVAAGGRVAQGRRRRQTRAVEGRTVIGGMQHIIVAAAIHAMCIVILAAIVVTNVTRLNRTVGGAQR